MPPPALPARKAPRRWTRIVRRIVVVVAILFVLCVGGFTWIAYWPFEGSVDRIESLVPADVEFVLRGSWKDLKANGWVQRNVFDHPLHPDLDPKALAARDGRADPDALKRSIAETETRINDSIPGALKPLMGLLFGTQAFGVEKDVLAGDIFLSGTFCGGAPARGKPDLPKPREVIALLRVTSLVKFGVAAMGHGFVREKIGPDVAVDEMPGGFLRIDLKSVVPTPKKYRTCEGGQEAPPENLVYVGRVKDVLAVSNSDDLMGKFVDLGNGIGRAVSDRGDLVLDPVEGGVVAAVDMLPLRPWLNRILSTEGDARGGNPLNAFIGKFLTPNALDRLNATVEPLGEDGLLARSAITYTERELHPQVKATYALSPEPFAAGIARLVPETDTFAVALLKAPPRALLQAVYDSLGRSDRLLIEDNVRHIGRRYRNVSEFLDELSQHVGTNTGVAFSRLSSIFDKVKYETWFSDEPDPQPVLTVLLRIGPGHSREQVDEFMSDRVQSLGFQKPEPVVRNGITYSRMEIMTKARDLELYKPAYLVTRDHLILTTNEDYLHRIIDVMGGKEADVADSPGFKACVNGLPGDATLALYANGRILRDYLWDRRNNWVNVERSSERHAAEYRIARNAYYKSRSKRPGGAIDPDDVEKINQEVDAEVARYRRDEYPNFVREYRGVVDAWKRFRGGAIVMAAKNGTIDGGVALLFSAPDGVPPDAPR